MNGADALLATLHQGGLEVCFTNPGTTEIHVVAAFDRSPIRAVACLFEGVATGAADGYARLSARPAATLLHLGPGLSNGWANLHNARRAAVPLVNVVGEHPRRHGAFDPPLHSRISYLVDALEGWSRRSEDVVDVARDGAAALSAAYGPPGCVATLTLPADVAANTLADVPTSWPVVARRAAAALDDALLSLAATALCAGGGAVLLGGALSQHHLRLAQRITDATSSRLLVETFPTIMDGGAGVPSPERVPYLNSAARAFLSDVETLVLIGARQPVAFFLHSDENSPLTRANCAVYDVAPPGTDRQDALDALVWATCGQNPTLVSVRPGANQERPIGPALTGPLNRRSFAVAVASTLPEGTVVVDESLTSGLYLYEELARARAHQWLTLTGGSIGFALPAAVGAAIATGARVLALESDGAMMYTPQALWTAARENLDVTVVALANHRYAILEGELAQLGVRDERAVSSRLLQLNEPSLDLAALARSLGVTSTRVTTAEDLTNALTRSYRSAGPTFIEAVIETK